MADGLLGGFSDFLLGGGKYADPNAINPQYGVPESDVRQAGINTLANVSALLLAAGQPMTGAQRGQLLAQIGPAFGGMGTDIYKSSQARLMNAQMRQQMQTLQEQDVMRKKRDEDPEALAKDMNIPVGLVKSLSIPSLIDVAKQVTIKRATKSPLEQLAEQRILQSTAGAVPQPAAAPAVDATQPAAEAPPMEAAPAMAPAGARVAPSAGGIVSMAAPVSQESARLRALAADPVIQAADPAKAKAFADLAEKLETPGMTEAAKKVEVAKAEMRLNQPKVQQALAGYIMKTENVGKKIDDALGRVSSKSAGYGSLLAYIPETEARNLQADLATIKANLGFQELQAMRENSPTGGALGQVAVQELNYLQAAVDNLDQAQDPAVLRKNLQNIKTIINKYSNLRQRAYEKDYGEKFNAAAFSGEEPAAQAAPAPAQGGTPQRVTREQYNALPSGALFLDPNGQLRRKP